MQPETQLARVNMSTSYSSYFQLLGAFFPIGCMKDGGTGHGTNRIRRSHPMLGSGAIRYIRSDWHDMWWSRRWWTDEADTERDSSATTHE